MIVIQGRAKKLKKGNYACPRDGIHRAKSSGRIRGFWGMDVGSTTIYYGNWAYYIGTGYKVFYSFKKASVSKAMDEVNKTVDIMKQLKDFCPIVNHVDYIKTDIFLNKKKHIAVAPAIQMQHIRYPEKAWRDFAKGKPYDWGADRHPFHSVIGFKAFRLELEKFVKNIDYNFDSFSIGNIVWCTVKKRWYLVDVR